MLSFRLSTPLALCKHDPWRGERRDGVICSIRQHVGQCGHADLFLVANDRTHSAFDLRSRGEAKSDVFDCIEHFCNPKCRHSTIGPKADVDRRS